MCEWDFLCMILCVCVIDCVILCKCFCVILGMCACYLMYFVCVIFSKRVWIVRGWVKFVCDFKLICVCGCVILCKWCMCEWNCMREWDFAWVINCLILCMSVNATLCMCDYDFVLNCVILRKRIWILCGWMRFFVCCCVIVCVSEIRIILCDSCVILCMRFWATLCMCDCDLVYCLCDFKQLCLNCV